MIEEFYYVNSGENGALSPQRKGCVVFVMGASR